MHAIGDKAVTMILDALQEAREKNGAENFDKNRHQVAHLQVVRPEDVKRFLELNVIANYQPLWCEG